MKKLDEGMKGTMADYQIASVAETAIMDVYPYSAEESITDTISENANSPIVRNFIQSLPEGCKTTITVGGKKVVVDKTGKDTIVTPKNENSHDIGRDALKGKKTKKKQKHNDEEHRIQCACVKYFNLRYPKLKGRLFAVPNGGRRDAVTASKLKAEGVIAGVSDLILLKSNRDYGALLIEMKKKGGYQSPSQKQWQKMICENREYKYVVCHSLDDFIREVDEFLKNAELWDEM